MGHCRSAARFETFGGRKSASPGCCGARVLALGCHPLTIGLLQKMLNIGGCRCRLQVSTKRIVAKLTRNVFQSPEVIARAIRWLYQQEKQLHWISVEAFKVDPILADGHGADQSVDTGMLRMRNGHTAADPGAAEIFPLHDRPDDALELVPRDLPSLNQGRGHLADHPFFRRGLDV